MKQKLKNLWNYFTTYEKIWFISITVLAFAFAIIFPEEDFGGVNGKVIMALYSCSVTPSNNEVITSSICFLSPLVAFATINPYRIPHLKKKVNKNLLLYANFLRKNAT